MKHRFDRRRPFAPWLHRIVVNRAIDHARMCEARREVGADAAGEQAASPGGDVAAARADRRRDRLRRDPARGAARAHGGGRRARRSSPPSPSPSPRSPGHSARPGAALAGWVKRTLGVEVVEPERVALGPVPGGGRLLVTGATGTWIVARDGSRTRLGSYTGATWSPRGLFVGAWRGRRLSAVAPDGRVAWSYATLGDVRDVRWSPDGFRIRTGRARAWRWSPGTAVARACWSPPRAAPRRPGARPSRTRSRGYVRTARRHPRRRQRAVGVALAERPRHRTRAAVVGGRAPAAVAGGPRRPRARRAPGASGAVAVPRGRRLRAAAWAPRGRRLALVVVERRGTSSVVVASGARRRLSGQRIFVTPGTLDAVAWSPDGRRLVVGAPRADQWLFLPASGRGRATAATPLARHFGGTPAVAGWCC